MDGERKKIIARAKKLLCEINQIFTDVTSFNENEVGIGERLINPDPEGELANIKRGLELMLERESKP